MVIHCYLDVPPSLHPYATNSPFVPCPKWSFIETCTDGVFLNTHIQLFFLLESIKMIGCRFSHKFVGKKI